MSVITIPKALRDKLGEEATDSLVVVLEKFEQSSQKGLAAKEDIHNLTEDIHKEIHNLREDTHKDIHNLEVKFEQRFAVIEADIRLIKWMSGVVIAGILSLVIRAFL